mgnify:CR=1 FL=1
MNKSKRLISALTTLLLLTSCDYDISSSLNSSSNNQVEETSSSAKNYFYSVDDEDEILAGEVDGKKFSSFDLLSSYLNNDFKSKSNYNFSAIKPELIQNALRNHSYYVNKTNRRGSSENDYNLIEKFTIYDQKMGLANGKNSFDEYGNLKDGVVAYSMIIHAVFYKIIYDYTESNIAVSYIVSVNNFDVVEIKNSLDFKSRLF